jgi:hypothetical protein
MPPDCLIENAERELQESNKRCQKSSFSVAISGAGMWLVQEMKVFGIFLWNLVWRMPVL